MGGLMPQTLERLAKIEIQIDTMLDMLRRRDIEIHAVREGQVELAQKMETLLVDKERRDGALGLGKWLISAGIPSLIGGAVLWIWHLPAGSK